MTDVEMMLSILQDIEDAIDKQIWDDLVRADFDAPDDAEVNVNLPMSLVRQIARVLTKINPTQAASSDDALSPHDQALIDSAWERHKAARPTALTESKNDDR